MKTLRILAYLDTGVVRHAVRTGHGSNAEGYVAELRRGGQESLRPVLAHRLLDAGDGDHGVRSGPGAQARGPAPRSAAARPARCARTALVPVPPPAPTPAPAAAAPKRCDATVSFSSDEVFEFNKAVLTATAMSKLDKDVVAKLPNCAKLELILVSGYTDRMGSQQYNQKLSEKRADAVKAYLVKKGVNASQIETMGMGKTLQIKSCPDGKDRKALIACLAPNRRAVVEIKGLAK